MTAIFQVFEYQLHEIAEAARPLVLNAEENTEPECSMSGAHCPLAIGGAWHPGASVRRGDALDPVPRAEFAKVSGGSFRDVCAIVCLGQALGNRLIVRGQSQKLSQVRLSRGPLLMLLAVLRLELAPLADVLF